MARSEDVKHEDPQVAVDTTNAFVDEYLSFRRQVFVEGSSELITERREATEAQLNANERAIARFLEKNNVADFDEYAKIKRQLSEQLTEYLMTTGDPRETGATFDWDAPEYYMEKDKRPRPSKEAITTLGLKEEYDYLEE